MKSQLLVATFVLFYALPLLNWPRAAGKPGQAVLFDFAAGRAYVFGFEFWPQDLFLLAATLIAAALALFLTNTLVGRVWCGFSCPQTLWTDLFFMIERWCEGDRRTRSRRDGGSSALRRHFGTPAKHGLWLAMALATGLTIVSYFTQARLLWPGFFNGSASLSASVFVLIFTATTYLLAGFAREAVCTHMCPWPRFQAAMLDLDTKVVAYREARGEPRGPLKRTGRTDSAKTGDCVDCGLCVAVCPTGIDIRDGLQLACIGCGLCADACDGVMARIGRPGGLVAFVSERQIGAERGEPVAPRPVMRPRILAFSGLLAAALAVLGWSLFGRSEIALNVAPERSPPYVQLSDGSIRNVYGLRLTLRGDAKGPFRLVTAGLEGAQVQVGQGVATGASSDLIALPASAGQTVSARLLVTVPHDRLRAGRTAFQLSLIDISTGETLIGAETYFWGPGSGGGS